jgi:hypothetical protein
VIGSKCSSGGDGCGSVRLNRLFAKNLRQNTTLGGIIWNFHSFDHFISSILAVFLLCYAFGLFTDLN